MRPLAELDRSLPALVRTIDPRRGQSNRWELAVSREQLRAQPRREAARQLVAFLDSGVDAKTGLPFRVGPGGWLATPPTLRVAALDWLAEFDLAAAADCARQVFATSNSADEWAVALRNYYRWTQSADDFFVARVAEAFGREDWLKNPSAGLAESVDFPVAIGGAQGYGILLSVLDKSVALRQPALAALDAWTEVHRQEAVQILAQEAATTGALDAESRATLLARADVRDEVQRAVVLSYLESAGVSVKAKTEFLRQFPNQNVILGYHLVTNPRPVTLQQGAQEDLAALGWVDEVIQAGRCAELKMPLAASRERLAGYVESARKGGKL